MIRGLGRYRVYAGTYVRGVNASDRAAGDAGLESVWM